MTSDIEIPVMCPACESILEEINGQLYCYNPECPAKMSKHISHFAKTMGIKGLGEKTIEKLDFININQIYDTHQDQYIAILGGATGQKLYSEVQNSKSAPFSKVLTALGIPGMGPVTAEKLAKTLSHINDLSLDSCKAAGVGPVSAGKIMEKWDTIRDEVLCLPLNFKNEALTVVSDKPQIVVCITGKLNDYKSREQASEYLTSLGFKVSGTITKKIDVLICEESRTSAKIEQAKKFNIPILTIKELVERYNK